MGRTAARSCAAVTALAAGFLARGAADAQETLIERAPEFAGRVDAAVAKGVTWLRSVQMRDGRFSDFGSDLERTALAYHTLRVCRVPADDRTAALAFESLRRQCQEEKESNKELDMKFGTDEAGLVSMALAGHGTVQSVTDESGEPSYVLTAADAAWMKELVKSIESTQLAAGWWPMFADVHEPGEEDLGSFDAVQGRLVP